MLKKFFQFLSPVGLNPFYLILISGYQFLYQNRISGRVRVVIVIDESCTSLNSSLIFKYQETRTNMNLFITYKKDFNIELNEGKS